MRSRALLETVTLFCEADNNSAPREDIENSKKNYFLYFTPKTMVSHRVLVLGDGNFSFSLALLKSLRTKKRKWRKSDPTSEQHCDTQTGDENKRENVEQSPVGMLPWQVPSG